MTVANGIRPPRMVLVAAVALALGLAIALVDSSPGWDSTGITAVALIASAGLCAYLGRRRPWLLALLVGAPTPLVEIAGSGATGSLLAIAFAAAGAGIGWALGRVA